MTVISNLRLLAPLTETEHMGAMTFDPDQVAVAIKRLVLRGKERGYVTYDELNAVLPPDLVSSEQIEDTICMFSEMGIKFAGAPLRAHPAEGEIDYAKLSREHIARYPKIRARLAE